MTYSNEKLLSRLLPFSALMALLLSCAGLYAALTMTVGQRRGEIAIRMAIGAAPEGIARMIFGDGLRLIVVGAVMGLFGGVMIARIIESQLYGVRADDWRVYAGVIAVLSVTAVVACMAPAMTAARTNPVEALKVE
jgi:ABC-type antimicrobial peptide transport system permease subunit